MQQFALTSGTGNRRGNAWTNRLTDTGTPALMTAGDQFDTITLGGLVQPGAAAVNEVRAAIFAGTPQAFEIVLLGLNGAVYAYTAGAGESLQDVLDGLVTAATGDVNWTAVRSGDTIECTCTSTGPQPDNSVAVAYLSTLVFLQLTGVTAAGDVTSLHVEASTYDHLSAGGDTKAHIATSLAALAATNEYWSVVWGGLAGLMVAQCLYPTESGDQIDLTIKQTLDVYGNPKGSLGYTKLVQTGDVVCSVIPLILGVDEILPTAFAVDIDGDVQRYFAEPGDDLDACAAALAALITFGGTTVYSTVANVITVQEGRLPFTVTDASANGGTAEVRLWSAGNLAEPVYPSTENFWLCQQQSLVSIAAVLVSGTSFKVTPHLYNNATGTWTAGTKSDALTANATISVDTTLADAMFVELSDFAGSGCATVTVQSPTP